MDWLVKMCIMESSHAINSNSVILCIFLGYGGLKSPCCNYLHPTYLNMVEICRTDKHTHGLLYIFIQCY